MPIPLAVAAGGAMMAGGLAGSIFGKKKKAKIDVAALDALSQQSAQKQKDLIGQQFEQLQPMTQKWEGQMKGLGEGIKSDFSQLGQAYKQNLGQVGQAEQATLESILNARQQQGARAIPLAQQNIREQAAAMGGMRTGGAMRAIQSPVAQAQQQQADLASQLASERLGREAQRLEKGTDVEMELNKEAVTQKLGIDRDTFDTLLNLGRTDLIEKLGALRGVEESQLQAALGARGLQMNVDMANTAAFNQRRQDLYNSLTGAGGMLMGSGIGGGGSKAAVATNQANVSEYLKRSPNKLDLFYGGR